MKRTGEALRKAFIRLVLSRRYEDIRVADIIAEADVGKSTFYEHFRGKEHLLAATLGGMLGVLAHADDPERSDSLTAILTHIWENRRLGRTIFRPPLDAVVRRMLADMILKRGAEAPPPNAARIRAVQIAGAHVQLLEAWTTGAVQGSPAEIAQAVRDVAAGRDSERRALQPLQ